MANIVLRLSTGSTSSTTNSTATSSLGGNMATNSEAAITTSNTTINNLWDNVTKAENYAGTTEYRCVFIHNDTSTSGALFANGRVYLSGSSLATFQLGVESAKNIATVTIASETTAPSGITFSSPTSSAPLDLMSTDNTLDPGEYIALWIKRTVNNVTGSGQVTDTLTINVDGTQ